MEDENQIMYKLGELVALVKANNEKLDSFIKDTKTNHSDHENRIKSLEHTKTRVYAIASTLGAGSSFVVAIILKATGFG